MIELVLDPRHASRVARVPPIAARRTLSRPRSTPADLVWYEHADTGLVLLRDGATFRLERPLLHAGWVVGAAVVAASDRPDELGHAIGAAPVARATFTGRRRRFALSPPRDGAPPVTLTVLAGILRPNILGDGVLHDGILEDGASDRPSCRVRLQGGDGRDLATLAGALMVGLDARPARAPLGAASADADERRPPAPPSPASGQTIDEALGSIVGALGVALLHWTPRAADGWAPLGRDNSAPLRRDNLAPLRGDNSAPSRGDGPTGHPVHQMRVAIRRLRSALLVFGDAIGDSLDCEHDALRALAATLGEARDWDVFLSATAPAIEAALPAGETLNLLRAEAEAARTRAYDALRATLGGDATRQLLAGLALVPFRLPWAEHDRPDAALQPADAADPDGEDTRRATLGAIAPALVDKRFRRLTRKRRSLDLPSDALHDVRKDAKKLRYTLEFLAEALPHRSTRKLVKRLGALQEALGAINDTATGSLLLDRLDRGAALDGASPNGAADGKRARENGIVVGWLAAQAARRREDLDTLWSAVRRHDRFWRS